jgi:predicted RNase H-like nuclease (RuvC/YqgF family)
MSEAIKMYQEQIESVKADPQYDAKQKENIVSFYEMEIWQINYKKEREERRRKKIRAAALARKVERLKAQLLSTQKELSTLVYDFKVFNTSESRDFRSKHEEVFRA